MSRAYSLEYERIVDVDNVPSGKACRCVCVGCNKPLIAKKGEIKVAHFAHDNRNLPLDHRCNWTPETEVHLLAKEIIAEDLQLRVDMTTLDRETTPNSKLLSFDQVLLEVRHDTRIPDVVAQFRGDSIHIEVAVTHFCDEQ